MKILCVIESYLPGNAGGGPVRAVANWERFATCEHELRIFTRHRDYLSPRPYTEVPADSWVERPGSSAPVWYASAADPLDALAAQAAEFAPDWLYLHGALPPLTRAILRRRRSTPALARPAVLLAPHGNLAPATLRRRSWRKRLWLAYARALGLYRGLRWHAASEREAAQIRAVFGSVAADIRVVPMAPDVGGTEDGGQRVGDQGPVGVSDGGWQAADGELRSDSPRSASGAGDRAGCPSGGAGSNVGSRKAEVGVSEASRTEIGRRKTEVGGQSGGGLRLVYFGRVSPEKNLGFAIDRLAELAVAPGSPEITLEIVGADQDGELARLRARLAGIRPAPRVVFSPALPPAELHARLGSGAWHALVLPSLSENFSYSVLESLQAGLAVVVSDQTPWRGLEALGVGWDLPLAQPAVWREALATLAAEDVAARARRAERARAFARAWCADYPRLSASLFQRP